MRPPIVLALVIAAASLAGAVAWNRLSTAIQAADNARRDYLSVERDGREVIRLREERATASLGEPPQDDLVARLGQIASESGLSRGMVRNVERVSDRSIGETRGERGFRRRDVRVTLEPVGPADLGRFLEQWRRSQPLWTVSNIDLEARRGRVQTGAPRYIARLQLSAAYAATTPSGTPSP